MKSLFICLGLYFSFCTLWAQSPALVGYWQNWDNSSSPYIQLDQVDSRYNVVLVAFAVPTSGTTYNMTFTPVGVTQATFIAQIQTLKNQGKRVGISIGGGGTTVKINNQTEQNTFVSSMQAIINTYGFDAMDLDLESGSLSISGGTIANPTDVHIIRMISAVKSIMQSYRTQHNNNKLFLTMAPETAHSTGGQSAWSGVWGSYLPIIHALRDSLDIMMVQLYNSGSMYGVDGNIYTQGTADFIVALGEAMIVGFNVDRWSNQAGPFIGLPSNKIAIALPACSSAAGGGYTAPTVVKSAIDYLRGTGPKPGSYTRISSTGYPNLRGMMTWSINWDAVSTCGPVYEFASNFETIFGAPVPVGLLYFTSAYHAERQEIELRWATGFERDNSGFELEHSRDGYAFETLGVFDGHQHSIEEQHYAFIHKKPEEGMHYYRLKQTDRDGRFVYSTVIAENIGSGLFLNVSPNPFSQKIRVDFGEEKSGILQIFDQNGRIVLRTDIEGSIMDFDLSGEKSGLYFIEYVTGNQALTRRLIKI